MTNKLIIGFILVIVMFFATANNVQGQTQAEAVAAFNSAANLLQTDTAKAIKAFEDCYAICEKVGVEADSLKTIASIKIPSLYFDQASKKAQAKKYAEAAAAYEEVVTVSQKYGDEATATKAKNNLPQLYFAVGLTAFNQKNDAEAIKNIEKAVSLDPDFTKAIYLSAAIYKRLNNQPKFVEALDLAIEKAKATNDSKIEADAIKLGKNTFLSNYINANKANKHIEAITNLKSALKYAPEDEDLYFYLGQSHAKANQPDLAIENINKAMELEKGTTPEDKAKYYFELGNAYKAKKDTVKACEAFKNAKYGKYIENAKYEIEVTLKCK